MKNQYKEDVHLKHQPTTNIIQLLKAAVKSNRGLLPFVTVGPAEAKDLLTLNRDNRIRSEIDIGRYAATMAAGKWKWIGQVIKIDNTERLIDGQAELMAVIGSGTKQLFHIQGDLSEDAYTVVDTNRPKSVADTLRTMGYRDVNNMSSAIRLVISISRHSRTPGTLDSRRPGTVVDSLEVHDWLKNKANAGAVEKALQFCRPLYQHGKLPFITLGQLSAIYYILRKIKVEDAEYFVEKFANGEINSGGKDRALFLARETLQQLQMKPKLRPVGIRLKDYRFRYIFNAWNLWRDGTRPKSLNPDMESPDMEKPR